MESKVLVPTKRIQKFDKNSSYVLFKGDDGLNQFIKSGGAGDSKTLVKFVLKHLCGYKNVPIPPDFEIKPGCTAIQVQTQEGSYLFGRNYDFDPHTMMIIKNEPKNGYRSLSSVDTTFITRAFGKIGKTVPLKLIEKFAMYVPVDGMNEKGLCLSINVICDDVVVNQERGKVKQIIVSAARMLLDRAANVDEAINLLNNCDMHSWKGFFCHMAIADATGKMVAAEYIDDELIIIPTKVMTNFYLKEGPKYGIGTEQSRIRYDRIMKHLSENNIYTPDMLKIELAGVAKSNFPDDTHTTEWSIVYDQKNLTATYYRREDYEHPFLIKL